ncbi:hypothetical protein BDQ17DRAFT_1258189, partial [Cyathus striatus]
SMSKTTIHKAGHWVGLYHMFQVSYVYFSTHSVVLIIIRVGCYGEGDMVDDTPAEDDSTYGCYISCDTYNYMNYSLDCCVYEFTPGQVVHMQDQLRTYRNIWIMDQPFLPHPYPQVCWDIPL